MKVYSTSKFQTEQQSQRLFVTENNLHCTAQEYWTAQEKKTRAQRNDW